MHMAAALAGYRTALVGTDWTISHLVSTNGVHALYTFCRGTISESVSSFQSGGAFAGWRALTIESMQMSGCGEGHEPNEIVSKKLWLKFPVAPAEVEIWTKKKVTIA